jgi:methyltransferase-like protein
MRGLLRDMMLYHAAKFERPEQQIEQARALIQWLAETVPSDKSPYGQLLQSELEQMKTWQDTYFRHDSLEEINEPIYFHQFVRRAERHGLQYLAEAELPTMLPGNYGAPVSETLNRLGRDIIELEQYLDFVRNRLFRQTLLCRRSVRLNRALGPWSLQPFHLGSALRPARPAPDLATDEPEEFKGPHSMMATTNQPLAKAALMELADAWPEVVAFEDLLRRVRSRLDPDNARQQIPFDKDREVLGGVLIQCVSQGVCELQVHSPPFMVKPGPMPCACPWARFRAAQGQPVANRRHEIVPLDNFRKRLLPLLDGRQEREALLERLIGMVQSGDLEVKINDTPVCEAPVLREVLAPELEKALREFGASALLVG